MLKIYFFIIDSFSFKIHFINFFQVETNLIDMGKSIKKNRAG